MLRMMVLDKNDNWNTHVKIINEESFELIEAIYQGNKAHIGEEALDNIQVAIGILGKLHHEGVDIQQLIHRHEKKLIGRDWKVKAVINIQIDKR